MRRLLLVLLLIPIALFYSLEIAERPVYETQTTYIDMVIVNSTDGSRYYDRVYQNISVKVGEGTYVAVEEAPIIIMVIVDLIVIFWRRGTD